MGNIVVGVDASPMSLEALRWADQQSLRTGSRILAVLSWNVPLPGAELIAGVTDAATAAAAVLHETVVQALGVERAAVVREIVSDDPPAQALLGASEDPDVLVVGPHTGGVFPGRHLGSVPHHLLNLAHCPVLVVRPSAAREPRIVVGVDGSTGSRTALRWAARQAQLEHLSIDAVIAWEWRPKYGVYPYGPASAEVQRGAEKTLHAEIAELDDAARRLVRPHVDEGHPAHVLCNRAAHAEMLVVGRRGSSSGPVGDLVGSVSSSCVRHALAPVLVVPEPGARRG